MVAGSVGSKTNPYVHIPTPFDWHYYGVLKTGHIVEGFSHSQYMDPDQFIANELEPQGIVGVVFLECTSVNPAYMQAERAGRLWKGATNGRTNPVV